MRSIWRFFCQRDTSTGALWLAVAAGACAGLGKALIFVGLLVAAIAFDLMTKKYAAAGDQ